MSNHTICCNGWVRLEAVPLLKEWGSNMCFFQMKNCIGNTILLNNLFGKKWFQTLTGSISCVSISPPQWSDPWPLEDELHLVAVEMIHYKIGPFSCHRFFLRKQMLLLSLSQALGSVLQLSAGKWKNVRKWKHVQHLVMQLDPFVDCVRGCKEILF